MPVVRERCSECNARHTRCPECDSLKVTRRETLPAKTTPTELVDFGGADEMEYKHYCWECGWAEYVTITTERTTEG